MHCATREEAEAVRQAIELRLRECRLELHPEKTRVVYCKDANRQGSHETESFDFPGYTFRPRRARSRRGEYFSSFTPAICNKAKKKIGTAMRQWKLSHYVSKTLEDLARMFNPHIRGWGNYFAEFCKSAMSPKWSQLNRHLVNWVRHKYRRFAQHQRRAREWLKRVATREPRLFAHWQMGARP